MANRALHHNGKHRGGDRRSEKARAEQAARQPSLVTEIAERRQQLDQTFFDHIRQLRQQHGDRAVDQALSVWQQQRDQVSITKQKERGPRLFGKF